MGKTNEKLLTLGLGHVTNIDSDSDIAALEGLDDLALVELVDHLLTTIFHNLLEGIAAESELENIWFILCPCNVEPAVVVVEEDGVIVSVPRSERGQGAGATYLMKRFFSF